MQGFDFSRMSLTQNLVENEVNAFGGFNFCSLKPGEKLKVIFEKIGPEPKVTPDLPDSSDKLITPPVQSSLTPSIPTADPLNLLLTKSAGETSELLTWKPADLFNCIKLNLPTNLQSELLTHFLSDDLSKKLLTSSAAASPELLTPDLPPVQSSSPPSTPIADPLNLLLTNSAVDSPELLTPLAPSAQSSLPPFNQTADQTTELFDLDMNPAFCEYLLMRFKELIFILSTYYF